jgi:protein arginine kinase
MEDLTAVPDSGLSWLDASGDHADIVLSTRVRLARNLQGYAFGARARVNDREAVLDQIRDAKTRVVPLGGSTVVNLQTLDTR